MITFIEGRHGKANSSHRDASFGVACRFTLTMTCLPSAISNLDFNGRTPKFVSHYFTASYLLGRGGICEMSTGSYVSWMSLFTHFACVVFSQFASSRSGKSGL